MVYIIDGLLDILLEMAEDADPGSITIRLAVSDADSLGDDIDLDPTVPVFTDLYFPSSGRSVEAVFGVDVSVPPGQTQGIFISHPDGPLEVTTTDDFAERVLIAIPPWDRDNVAAFDRRGREHPIRLVEGFDLAEADFE